MVHSSWGTIFPHNGVLCKRVSGVPGGSVIAWGVPTGRKGSILQKEIPRARE
jgi:hypothetical protein